MSKKIMVIDDTADTVEATTELLQIKGFKVFPYTEPEKALIDLKAGKKPDLIILDMRMPKMSGPEFADAVHADKSIAKTRIAFFTASSDLDPSLLKKHNVLGYIFKPFEIDELVRQINKFSNK